jgi:flagellar biosynthesis anti-sigma factor FlgM
MRAGVNAGVLKFEKEGPMKRKTEVTALSRINGYATHTLDQRWLAHARAKTPSGAVVASPAQGRAADAFRVSADDALVPQAIAGSDARMEKVAALRAAIAEGTYEVSAGAVADRMIESLLGER